MANFTLQLHLFVFDEDLLIAAANQHAIKTTGVDMGDLKEDIPSCLQMIFDPADGTQAYVGKLSEIGVQIEESICS